MCWNLAQMLQMKFLLAPLSSSQLKLLSEVKMEPKMHFKTCSAALKWTWWFSHDFFAWNHIFLIKKSTQELAKKSPCQRQKKSESVKKNYFTWSSWFLANFDDFLPILITMYIMIDEQGLKANKFPMIENKWSYLFLSCYCLILTTQMEYDALMKNKMWILKKLPIWKQPISRWIFG